ncbi:MAG: DNA internalization-related competence protein ComEC/Rec2 [Alteromonadaceae bacterium]|nr:MAG: DNA internalization-related competence protein ComEC/Rec2 [Alteromonadaceae bacterium]
MDMHHKSKFILVRYRLIRLSLLCFTLGLGLPAISSRLLLMPLPAPLSFLPNALPYTTLADVLHLMYSPLTLLILLSVCCFLSMVYWRLRRHSEAHVLKHVLKKVPIQLLFVLSVVLLGFVFGFGRLHNIVEAQMPQELEGENLVLELIVLGLPQVNHSGLRFEATVHSAELLASDASSYASALEQLVGKKIRLSWRDQDQLKPGERWRLTVRLKRPRGFVNPEGFDYHAWLLQQGYAATGYVKGKAENRLLSVGDAGFSGHRYALRERLFGEQNEQGEPHLKWQGVLQALLLGDKSRITQAQWTVFSATGTVHLMAISGLHIGLVAALFYWLARWPALVINVYVRARLPWDMLRIVPVLASVFAATIYATLAGFSIPTLRAWILVLVLNMAVLLKRRTSVFNTLIVAALVILLLDPMAMLQPGFVLSFSAVAILLFAFGFRAKPLPWWQQLPLAQLVIFVGLSAALLILNLPISLSGPVANLVAVPLMSFVTIPLTLLAGMLSFINNELAMFILTIAGHSMQWLWVFLSELSQFDDWLDTARLDTGWLKSWRFSSLSLIAFTGACLLLLMPRIASLQLLALSLILGVFFSQSHQVKPAFTMTVLDVGQGLAIVTQSQKQVELYDTGARFSPSFDIGSRVVVPFLRSQGITGIDQLTISHGDNDHIGGLDGVLDVIKVNTLRIGALGEPSLTEWRGRTEALDFCRKGQGWRTGLVEVSVLWPDVLVENDRIERDGRGGAKNKRLLNKRNNHSCVLSMRIPGEAGRPDRHIVLLGDIEKRVESWLVQQRRLPQNIDVLIAAHHGSNTSSVLSLVEHVRAKHVIFSTGFRNRYGHPTQLVKQRFIETGARLWNTATQGAIRIHLDGNGEIQLRAERAHAPKLWTDLQADLVMDQLSLKAAQ